MACIVSGVGDCCMLGVKAVLSWCTNAASGVLDAVIFAAEAGAGTSARGTVGAGAGSGVSSRNGGTASGTCTILPRSPISRTTLSKRRSNEVSLSASAPQNAYHNLVPKISPSQPFGLKPSVIIKGIMSSSC